MSENMISCITESSAQWIAHVKQIHDIDQNIHQINRGVSMMLLLVVFVFMMVTARNKVGESK